MASPWEEARAKQKISAPKESKYHGYQGQPGGISSVPSSGKKDAFVNLQRQKFFGDRKDVPEERVLRRTRQEGGVNQFKQALIDSGRVLKDSKGNPVMNPNTGEPVYLTDVPGGRTVGDVSRDFANRFGPTPKEVMGDIGYGASKMLQAYGIPFVSTATKIGSAVSDAWNKIRDYFGTGSQAQGIETQIPQPSSDVRNYFSSMGITNTTPMLNNQYFADASQSDIDRINKMRQLKSMDSQSIYDMKDVFQLSPELTLDEIQKIKEGTITQPTGMYASVQAGDGPPVLPPNVVPKTIVREPTPKEMNLYKTPVLPPEVTDPRVYEGQRLYAENTLPNSVMNLYDIARNPQVNTPYGNLRLDNVLSGNPQLGFETDLFGGKIGLSANPLQDQYGANYTLTFNKGGSVDKYSGLGYMLK